MITINITPSDVKARDAGVEKSKNSIVKYIQELKAIQETLANKRVEMDLSLPRQTDAII